MNNLNKIIIKYLEENYENMICRKNRKEIKLKLIELWTMRACRFFVESNLDESIVSEDLFSTNLEDGIKYEREIISKF